MRPRTDSFFFFRIAVFRAQVDAVPPRSEEEEVGHHEGVVFSVGETVLVDGDSPALWRLFGGVRVVEAVEEAAVQKRGNCFHLLHEVLGIFEKGFVAEEVCGVMMLSLLAELALAVALIEHGEEEVLQDGLVIARVFGFRVKTIDQFVADFSRIEKCIWDEVSLLDEPDE